MVAVFGSAAHTALFPTQREHKPMGLLCGKTVKGRFLLADAIKPVDTAFINCPSPTDAPGSPSRLSSFASTWTKPWTSCRRQNCCAAA